MFSDAKFEKYNLSGVYTKNYLIGVVNYKELLFNNMIFYLSCIFGENYHTDFAGNEKVDLQLI